jgi:hypothetical protein
MTTRAQNMKKLEAFRDSLKQQISDLHQQLMAVEQAIRLVSGDAEPIKGIRPRTPRPNVKQMLLDMLKEVGDAGLNAGTAVEMAAQRGEKLERGTASSLLSRWKSDRVVSYDGTVYRLVPQAPSSGDPEEDAAGRVH